VGTLEWVSGKVKEIRSVLLKRFFALVVGTCEEGTSGERK
jgi:hypothetical protein